MRVSLRPDHLGFALRLQSRLAAEEPGGGLVWSPYSVAGALGLVATGARGATRDELGRLLGGDIDAELAALDDAVVGGPELATGTGLWVRDTLPLLPGFEAALRARPGSAVHTADFAGAPESVRRAVNGFIAKATRDLIPDLLPPGGVDPGTQALLANALWVRMQWTVPFDPAATRDIDFHAPAGTRPVPMMRRRARMPLAQTAGWRMVTLAGGDELALDILLPDDSGTAPVPEGGTLAALYRAAAPAEVALALPRFDLTHRAELATAVTALGAPTVFTDSADLSGISEHPLRIDQVVHEARLRVDEKGAEGAAATAVLMPTAAVVPKPPVGFTADRPFGFVLRRRAAILFLGTVADPVDPGPAG
ncbi:serpin family protein [Nocardiopsis sediminis]|uniref:Serpin family protein n=1 Tax=Nocardiopsis sediminis TaxID=1778267 RepID=A0ABV8FSZ7_9ACTN